MIIKKLLKSLFKISNKLLPRKSCYICDENFYSFSKYRGENPNLSQIQQSLQMVGSDLDNYGCFYCGSTDRERHLFMYFDYLDFWKKFEGADILHLAPEANLKRKIVTLETGKYVQGDLYPKCSDEIELDATNIQFESGSFDCVIASHILEHIPNHKLALSEFHRILRPNGTAVLQTPYSKLLANNFEDPNIDTPKLMELFHGQNDHVRTFGERNFYADLEGAGFKLIGLKHQDCFEEKSAFKYGVNYDEDLVLVQKVS